MYQVPTAADFSSENIILELSADNACRFLDLALLYDVTKLRDHACDIIDKNAREALESEDFLEISQGCLMYILKGDTFYAEETFIFQRAMEWGKAECHRKGNENPDDHTIRTTLGEAFYYLRVPTLALDALVECTRTNDYFSFNEYKDIVAAISGADISVKSNLHRRRVPLKENPVFRRIYLNGKK